MFKIYDSTNLRKVRGLEKIVSDPDETCSVPTKKFTVKR